MSARWFTPLFLALSVLSVCGCICGTEEEIKNQIDKANHCEIDSDCKVVDFGCPFGCGSYVNKNADLGYLDAQLSIYRQTNLQCEYRCIHPPVPICEDNKCAPMACEIGVDYEQITVIEGKGYPTCKCPENTQPKPKEERLRCVE
jgi:hypothetical protein